MMQSCEKRKKVIGSNGRRQSRTGRKPGTPDGPPHETIKFNKEAHAFRSMTIRGMRIVCDTSKPDCIKTASHTPGSSWSGTAIKNAPALRRANARLLPPQRGRFLPWGGPAVKKRDAGQITLPSLPLLATELFRVIRRLAQHG